MRCFNHTGTEAVGLCKSCNKAVCPACARLFPRGMACSVACEEDAKELVEMSERAKKLYGIGAYQNNKLASAVWIWLLLTAMMVSGAVYVFVITGKLDYVISASTVVFLIITLIVYRASKRTGIQC
ncbi:MAG: hypothetical protein V4812_04755 [Pseudomonadota bacterium]